jgi:uncharacterized protein (DUF488 family)
VTNARVSTPGLQSENVAMNVYTIGYEGLDINALIDTLRSAEVKALADVRAVPISRKKGFSKTALQAHLERAGIRYLHFVKLGNPKAGRDAAKAGQMDSFRRIYKRHLSNSDSMQTLNLLSQVVLNNATCLLCFERDPATCHRSMIADRLEALGSTVVHLFGGGTTLNVGQSSKRAGSHPRQSASSAQQEIR